MEAKTIIINKVIMEMERILSQDQLDILYTTVKSLSAKMK